MVRERTLKALDARLVDFLGVIGLSCVIPGGILTSSKRHELELAIDVKSWVLKLFIFALHLHKKSAEPFRPLEEGLLVIFALEFKVLEYSVISLEHRDSPA